VPFLEQRAERPQQVEISSGPHAGVALPPRCPPSCEAAAECRGTERDDEPRMQRVRNEVRKELAAGERRTRRPAL